MPSLNELNQLKDIFGEIAHENATLLGEGLEPPVYDLPKNEPSPRSGQTQDAGTPSADTPAPAAGGPADTPPSPAPTGSAAAPSAPASADADTVDTLSTPTPAAGSPDTPSSSTPADAETAAAPSVPLPAATPDAPNTGESGGDDDESIFDDLLDGFSDLITDVSPSAELPPPDADTPAATGGGDLDLNIPEDAAASAALPPDAGTAPDGGDLDFAIPEDAVTPAGSGAEANDSSGGEEIDLGSLLENFGGGDDTDAEPPAPENAAASVEASASNTEDAVPQPEDSELDDIPSVSEISDEEKASLFPDVPPEELKIDVEPPPKPDKAAETPPEPVVETPPAAEEEGGQHLGDLPELEDFLAPIDSMQKPAAVEAAPAEVEKKTEKAISLTEQQLQQLLDTLASYPLNLRITCEKIISEEIVEPALLSQFINLLIQGGNAREAAALAGKILKKKVRLPKGYKTGEELERERSSFIYIFTHKFLPVIRVGLVIAALAASVTYLSYEFIYKPVRAYTIYKNGYERVQEGEYAQGNRRFSEAFSIHPVKKWFYRYAELFRDEKQYLYAEEKYDELLLRYPNDKKGALDYAAMETDYLRNYEKADRIIRANILDYKLDDREGLLALGDANLAWGEYDPSRYEEARLAYAKLLAAYGQSDPVMERMMLYFIRTDKLGEVIPLQNYFMGRPKSKISAASLAELGGYLLDKRFEVVKGVPDEHIEEIEGVRDVLLRSAKQDFSLPEVHYHLARYYSNYGATLEERQMLETAADAFDAARLESPKRTRYRVDTQRRLARLMIADREFIAAEEALAKGVNIMEDAVERRVIQRAPEFGELYAYLGDLAYFVKSGDMNEAVDFYLNAEENGWAPPEMRYRLGSAYYKLGQYAPAMDCFFTVSMETPYNRRLLNALGAASYMRSDYSAAEGYYKRLINMLESERSRFPLLIPNERPEHREIVERMMVARNNLGVTYNALAARTGRSSYRAEALGELAESARAWDTLERNPQTLIRAGITDTPIPGASLPYLNIQNTLYPTQDSNGLLFMQIDKDLSDNSWWESLMHSEGLP